MMKAIGFKKTGPIDAPDSLLQLEADKPEIRERDILVEVRGVSVNPVDTKVRKLMQAEQGGRILGYDAAGVVREVGTAVRSYSVGDEVFYAGDLTRPGTNAELHAVDERIVGKKPASLDFAEAAALPLCSITAWELLFDCLAVPEGGGAGDTLLIIGGAGGVGSILIQLAKVLTGLTVVATASRPETRAWVEEMGADHVINHRESLVDQLNDLGLHVRYVAALTATDEHMPAILELIQPRGHIAIIDDPETLDIKAGKRKSLSFSWEFMFARPMFETSDIEKQQELLNRVSNLLDEGRLKCTATNNLGTMSVEALKEAHKLQESGTVIGKNVLKGF